MRFYLALHTKMLNKLHKESTFMNLISIYLFPAEQFLFVFFFLLKPSMSFSESQSLSQQNITNIQNFTVNISWNIHNPLKCQTTREKKMYTILYYYETKNKKPVLKKKWRKSFEYQMTRFRFVFLNIYLFIFLSRLYEI